MRSRRVQDRAVRCLLLLLALLASCRDRPVAPRAAIAIAIAYPAAAPEIVEARVVRPIEHAVARVRGVATIEARATEGQATIVLVLARDTDVGRALHDVRDALDVTRASLPADTEFPIVTPTHEDERPVAWLALRGPLPLDELSAQARDRVAPALLQLPGVAAVAPHGLAERALLVRPDLDRLAAHQVPLFELLAIVQASDIRDVAAVRDLVLAQHAGTPIRIGDVASVELGVERAPDAPEPVLAIHAMFTADPRTVKGRVRDALASLALPPEVTVVETASPVGERPRAPLVRALVGDALDDLRQIADGEVAALAAAGITDVVRDPPAGEPEDTVVVDRARAAALGISFADIHASLRALAKTRLGDVAIAGRRLPLVIEPVISSLADALPRVLVRTPQGAFVPLGSLVTWQHTSSEAILRRDHRRTITLAIYASEAQLAKARALLAERSRALPAGVTATTR